MATINEQLTGTPAHEILLHEHYANDEDSWETVVRLGQNTDDEQVILLCQKSASREDDDDYIAISREQFLQIAAKLRAH